MRENPYVVALSEYPVIASGKVRQLHAVDDDHLLLVASDRISAYDHVLDTPIPDKGRVLTAMSVFWFELLADLVSTHFVSADDARVPDEVRGRALLVRRLSMLPVECVARGYLTGSGLAEYREAGRVCGVTLPSGLTEASRLPEPIFTPTTKAEVGGHDEHIGMAEVASKVGDDLADELRTITLGLYQRAAEHAAGRGVLLADTKFEFGLNERGEPVLADEVCTPDSSRYWPADDYAPGQTQSSFDKQYVRDWLSSAASGWDRTSGVAPPALPEAVVRATRERYVEAYERITGRAFADWLRPLG